MKIIDLNNYTNILKWFKKLDFSHLSLVSPHFATDIDIITNYKNITSLGLYNIIKLPNVYLFKNLDINSLTLNFASDCLSNGEIVTNNTIETLLFCNINSLPNYIFNFNSLKNLDLRFSTDINYKENNYILNLCKMLSNCKLIENITIVGNHNLRISQLEFDSLFDTFKNLKTLNIIDETLKKKLR